MMHYTKILFTISFNQNSKTCWNQILGLFQYWNAQIFHSNVFCPSECFGFMADSMFIAEDLTEIVQKLHFRIFFNIVSRFLFYLMRMRLRQRKLIGFVTTFSSWIRYDETSTVRLTVQNVNILKCWTLKTIEYKLSRFHSCWRNECFEMFTLEFELKFTLEFEI